MYVCGITPYDATHLGHAATMITFDLVNRLWRDAGHEVNYVQNVTDIDDPLLERAAARRRGLGGPGDARDRAVPRGHGGAADHPAGALRRCGRVDPGDRRRMSGSCSTAARRTGSTTAAAMSTSPSRRRRPSATSPTCPATQMLRAVRGARRRPGARRQARPARPAAVARRPRRRAGLGRRRPRPGPPRLAHRVRQSSRWACSARRSTCRAAATTCSTRTTSVPPRTPRSSPVRRRSPRHYVHAGMIGLDGEKMSKSKGNLVFVSRLRADRVDPMAVRLALMADHYRADRQWTDEVLKTGQQRLARWREAAAAPTGPSGDDLLAAVRARPGRRPRHPGRAVTAGHLGGRRAGRRRRRPAGPRPDGPHRRRPAGHPTLRRLPARRRPARPGVSGRTVRRGRSPGQDRGRRSEPGSGTPR